MSASIRSFPASFASASRVWSLRRFAQRERRCSLVERMLGELGLDPERRRGSGNETLRFS